MNTSSGLNMVEAKLPKYLLAGKGGSVVVKTLEEIGKGVVMFYHRQAAEEYNQHVQPRADIEHVPPAVYDDFCTMMADEGLDHIFAWNESKSDWDIYTIGQLRRRIEMNRIETWSYDGDGQRFEIFRTPASDTEHDRFATLDLAREALNNELEEDGIDPASVIVEIEGLKLGDQES
jgi:hypothetical protein